jgi:TPR repeat protein
MPRLGSARHVKGGKAKGRGLSPSGPFPQSPGPPTASAIEHAVPPIIGVYGIDKSIPGPPPSFAVVASSTPPRQTASPASSSDAPLSPLTHLVSLLVRPDTAAATNGAGFSAVYGSEIRASFASRALDLYERITKPSPSSPPTHTTDLMDMMDMMDALSEYAQFMVEGLGGVPYDSASAVKIFAALGTEPHLHVPSMERLGTCLRKGQGGRAAPSDPAEAVLWQQRAHQTVLERHGGDFSVHPRVLSSLGFFYHFGGPGISVDLRAAKDLYDKGCALGDGAALSNVAFLLVYNNNNDESSRGSIGNIFGGDKNELGLERDRTKAAKLAAELRTQAVLAGCGVAAHNTGILAEFSSPAMPSEATTHQGGAAAYARAMYEVGADLGDEYSLARLGDMCEAGKGGAKDLERARECFWRAQMQGSTASKNSLQRVELKLGSKG